MQWDSGYPFLHCHVSKWCPATLREMKKEWPLILEAFHVSGVNRIYSCVPKHNAKINKWQVLWGMEEMNSNDDVVIYCKYTGSK